jgi:hypothetical protein
MERISALLRAAHLNLPRSYLLPTFLSDTKPTFPYDSSTENQFYNGDKRKRRQVYEAIKRFRNSTVDVFPVVSPVVGTCLRIGSGADLAW